MAAGVARRDRAGRAAEERERELDLRGAEAVDRPDAHEREERRACERCCRIERDQAAQRRVELVAPDEADEERHYSSAAAGRRSRGDGATRTTRANGAGSHQFQRPKNAIRLGTSSERTTVASTKIATASPSPNSCRPTMRPATKPENAAHMITAAAVMMRPVRSRPCATAVTLSAPRSHVSRIRVTRNTS